MKQMYKFISLSSRGISEEYTQHTIELEYAHDSKGNIVKATSIVVSDDGYKNGGGSEYEYDSQGNCVLYKVYDLEGETVRWRKAEYDGLGNCLVETDFDREGDIEMCDEYEYDIKGNVVRRMSNDSVYGWVYGSEYNYLGDVVISKKIGEGRLPVT